MQNDTEFFFYCERSSQAFWAEPINAISNLFFVIIGLICFYLEKKKYNNDVIILSISLISIGLFSFLFHTLSTFVFGILDVLSILLFSLLYFYFFNKRFFLLSNKLSLFLTFLFFGYLFLFSYLISLTKIRINGSEQYFSLIFVLILYFFLILFKKKDFNILMLISIFILIISIFF